MTLRLSTSFTRIIRTTGFLQRPPASAIINRNVVKRASSLELIRNKDDGENEDKDEDDVPKKYLGSKAQMYRARDNWQSPESDTDHIFWFEPWVVITCFATFLVYFGILREENDIDRLFDLTLEEQLERLRKEKEMELAQKTTKIKNN